MKQKVTTSFKAGLQRWMIPITNKALFYSSEKKKETKKKDIYTYTEELDKLAKLGTDESAYQAEQMLMKLERNSKDGHSLSSSSFPCSG